MRAMRTAVVNKIPFCGIDFCYLHLSNFTSTISQQASKQASLYLVNKGLLLPARSLFGRQLHSFSDSQGIDFLCLEKLYQSNFTAAKSSNGLSRLFCVLTLSRWRDN
jgi:hypothetical protein